MHIDRLEAVMGTVDKHEHGDFSNNLFILHACQTACLPSFFLPNNFLGDERRGIDRGEVECVILRLAYVKTR